MLYAHTPNSSGQWHELQAHLQATAAMARAFAVRFGAGDLAYYAGLWHDMGKFHPKFQAYLQACAQGKRAQPHPHARYGAAYAGATASCSPSRLWDTTQGCPTGPT
jgi:CRISPR-associated endonuclease/helicase Cas3